jgi:uncharacterized protein YkwD
MVRKHYFAHVSPAHRDVVDRVESAGYNGRGRFAVQENIFWWSAPRSPAAVLQAFMNSSVHRANVLNPAWRHVGFATIMRSPFGRTGVTVVVVFGVPLN